MPTKALIPGKNFWRVRSVAGSTKSDWVNGSFTVAPVTTPIPLAPRTAAVLQQPQSPPLLQWSSSQGAISYTVEVDGDADLIGAKVYTHEDHLAGRARPPHDRRLVLAGHRRQGRRPDQPSVERCRASTSSRSPPPSITYPANDVNPAHRGRRPRLDAGARRQDLRRAGRDRRRLQQHHPERHQRLRHPLLAAGHPATTTSSGGGSARSTWPASRRPGPRRCSASSVSGPTSRRRCTRRALRTSLALPYVRGPSTSGRRSSTPRPTSSTRRATRSSAPASTSARRPGTTYVPRSSGDCGCPYQQASPTGRCGRSTRPYPPSPGLPGVFSRRQAFTWTAPDGGTRQPFDQSVSAHGLKRVA